MCCRQDLSVALLSMCPWLFVVPENGENVLEVRWKKRARSAAISFSAAPGVCHGQQVGSVAQISKKGVKNEGRRKPKRKLTNKEVRAAHGNIPKIQATAKAVLWNVLRWNQSEQNIKNRRVAATIDDLGEELWALMALTTHLINNRDNKGLNDAIRSSGATWENLKHQQEMAEREWTDDERKLACVAKDIANHKMHILPDYPIQDFKLFTDRRRQLPVGASSTMPITHPTEYHKHRRCRTPWESSATFEFKYDPDDPQCINIIEQQLKYDYTEEAARKNHAVRYGKQMQNEIHRLQELLYSAIEIQKMVQFTEDERSSSSIGIIQQYPPEDRTVLKAVGDKGLIVYQTGEQIAEWATRKIGQLQTIQETTAADQVRAEVRLEDITGLMHNIKWHKLTKEEDEQGQEWIASTASATQIPIRARNIAQVLKLLAIKTSTNQAELITTQQSVNTKGTREDPHKLVFTRLQEYINMIGGKVQVDKTRPWNPHKLAKEEAPSDTHRSKKKKRNKKKDKHTGAGPEAIGSKNKAASESPRNGRLGEQPNNQHDKKEAIIKEPKDSINLNAGILGYISEQVHKNPKDNLGLLFSPFQSRPNHDTGTAVEPEVTQRTWEIQGPSAGHIYITATNMCDLQRKIEEGLKIPKAEQIISKTNLGQTGMNNDPITIHLSSKAYWTEVEWVLPIRKRNKRHHAMHGNGMTKEEIQEREDELSNNVLAAIKAHPTYQGKPLGNLIKWIKKLVSTKPFRDQCNTTEHKKPNQLAQYAISQAQWLSTQEGNPWSLKAAQERAKGKGKGKTKDGKGKEDNTNKGKGKAKGKGKEKGAPWAQLNFKPIEFEMYQQGVADDCMTDEENKPRLGWIRPPKVTKDQFIGGATGLAFLTTNDFAEKAGLALHNQKPALAALVPSTVANLHRFHPELFEGNYEMHNWRGQEITLTVFDGELPELKSATMLQFGGYEVVSSQIQPDITFQPSEKIEIIVIWEIEKYPTQPSKEEIKETIEKLTSTPLAEMYAFGQAVNRGTNKQYGWQCICKMLPKTAEVLMKTAGKADIYPKYFTRQGAAPPVEMTPISFPPSVTKQEVFQLGSVQKGWQGLAHNDRGYSVRIENTHLPDVRLKLRGPNSKHPDPRIDADTTKVLGKYKYRMQGAQAGSDALEVPRALRGWGKWETRVETMWVYKGTTCANIAADQPPPHNAPTAYPRTSEGKTYPVVITPLNQPAKDVLLTPRRSAGTSPRGSEGSPSGSTWLANGAEQEPPQFGKGTTASAEGSPQSLGSPASFSTEVSGEVPKEQTEKVKTPEQKMAPILLEAVMAPAIEKLRQADVETQLRREIEEGKKNAQAQEKELKAWVTSQLEEVKKHNEATTQEISAVQKNVFSLGQGQEEIKQSISSQSREISLALQQGFALMAGMGTGQVIPQLALDNLGQAPTFQFGGNTPPGIAGSAGRTAPAEEVAIAQARQQEEERKKAEDEHNKRLQLQVQQEAQRLEEEKQRALAEEQRLSLEKLHKQEEKRKEEEARQKKKEEVEAKEKEKKATEALKASLQASTNKPEARKPPEGGAAAANTRERSSSRSPHGADKQDVKEKEKENDTAS